MANFVLVEDAVIEEVHLSGVLQEVRVNRRGTQSWALDMSLDRVLEDATVAYISKCTNVLQDFCVNSV